MKLIINTLLSVLFVQLLGFSYIKFFHNKTTPTLQKDKLTYLTKNYIIKRKPKYLYENLPKKEKKIKIKKTTSIKKIYSNKTIKTVKKTIDRKKTIDTNSKIEKYAKKFLGYKYVWGATGPKSFDCSGFTQKVYRKSLGIIIPRVSREQAKIGKYIKYSELKKGDMVFFDTTKKHLGEVNHVGIYLSDGNFIHASSGGKKVMITNFNKKRFYKNRFLWGRRIIQEHPTVATLINHQNKEES